MAGGWWLVAGGWWLVAGRRRADPSALPEYIAVMDLPNERRQRQKVARQGRF